MNVFFYYITKINWNLMGSWINLGANASSESKHSRSEDPFFVVQCHRVWGRGNGTLWGNLMAFETAINLSVDLSQNKLCTIRFRFILCWQPGRIAQKQGAQLHNREGIAVSSWLLPPLEMADVPPAGPPPKIYLGFFIEQIIK